MCTVSTDSTEMNGIFGRLVGSQMRPWTMLVLSMLPMLGLVLGTQAFWGLHADRIEASEAEIAALADAELVHVAHGHLIMVHSTLIGNQQGFVSVDRVVEERDGFLENLVKLEQGLTARRSSPSTTLNDREWESLDRTLVDLRAATLLMADIETLNYGFTESNAFARATFDLSEIWNQANLNLGSADMQHYVEQAKAQHNYLVAFASERIVIMEEVNRGRSVSTSIDVVQRVAAASAIRSAAFSDQRAIGLAPIPQGPTEVGVDPGGFYRPWGYGIVDGTRTDLEAWYDATEGVLMDGDGAISRVFNDVLANSRSNAEQARRNRTVNAAFTGAVLLLSFGLVWLTRREIADRRRVERAHTAAIDDLTDQAAKDGLTGLWNRTQVDRLVDDCCTTADEDESVVVAYVDLDEFKPFNDVWGHERGDFILLRIAKRLELLAGERWSVVRFGGDEFVLAGLMQNANVASIADFGRRIVDEIAVPIKDGRQIARIEATVGLAFADRETAAASELLLEADAAMVLAKKRQRGSALVYDRDNQRDALLLRSLPGAIDRGEVGAWFQPAYDMASNELVAVEALARWTQPDGSMVSPGEFIPLAESYGLVSRVTANILALSRKLLDDPQFPKACRVWINVSAVELDSRDFGQQFIATARDLGVDLSRIGVELTETAAIRHPRNLRDGLKQLRSEGAHVAIDDFGNGYSPLGFLRDLPFDVLKLDRSIVSHIDTQKDLQLLVVGIVGMVREIGVEVVAEGIERVEEFRWLRSIGVHTAQGFLLAKPMPVKQLMRSLEVPQEIRAMVGPMDGASATSAVAVPEEGLEFRGEVIS